MSLSKRRDFGVRVAGDKGRYPDEFVTKRQIVPGTNITITHLENFDIMISSNGGGGGGSALDTPQRDLYVELKLVRPFDLHGFHYDINENSAFSAEYRKYFGSHVFAEIRHNWQLNTPDSFQYSVLDIRTQQGINAPFNKVNSIPKVVGVTNNKIRIIGTDAVPATRFNPYYWVDVEEGKMKDTRLLHFKANDPSVGLSETLGDYTRETPTYRIRITEVKDWQFDRYAPETLDSFNHGFSGV